MIFLRAEQEKADEEYAKRADSDQARYAASGAHDVVDVHHRWMERAQWGTKTPPVEPCIIGDAQSELILLMIANNVNSIYPRFYSLFCEGKKKLIDAFNKNDWNWRLDLDPKVPYLGEDQNGVPIEPTEQQLEECYNTYIKGTKSDIGLDGYLLSYRGTFHMKG
eukprot:s290_g21.t1